MAMEGDRTRNAKMRKWFSSPLLLPLRFQFFSEEIHNKKQRLRVAFAAWNEPGRSRIGMGLWLLWKRLWLHDFCWSHLTSFLIILSFDIFWMQAMGSHYLTPFPRSLIIREIKDDNQLWVTKTATFEIQDGKKSYRDLQNALKGIITSFLVQAILSSKSHSVNLIRSKVSNPILA